jgi:hypothetical protein
MAKTITQLPDATTVGASDEMIIQQGGITKRATIAELKTEVAALGANNITVSSANRSITNTTNHALSFGTNNTERVRIAASGNVGIGTATPSQALHVDGVLQITRSSYPVLQIQQTGSTGVGQVAVNGDVFELRQTQNFPMALSTNNTERMRIAASGNVGVGTSSPNAAAVLDVSSTTQGFLPPRMTTAERNAIAAPVPAGLMVYNTTTNKLNFYNGTAWEAVTSA